MTLAERFDAWAKAHEQKGIDKGIAKGIEKGIEKGEALLLQRQLARRFGTLPNEVLTRISVATTEQLETWGDRVLDAVSLDEVFHPHN